MDINPMDLAHAVLRAFYPDQMTVPFGTSEAAAAVISQALAGIEAENERLQSIVDGYEKDA